LSSAGGSLPARSGWRWTTRGRSAAAAHVHCRSVRRGRCPPIHRECDARRSPARPRGDPAGACQTLDHDNESPASPPRHHRPGGRDAALENVAVVPADGAPPHHGQVRHIDARAGSGSAAPRSAQDARGDAKYRHICRADGLPPRGCPSYVRAPGACSMVMGDPLVAASLAEAQAVLMAGGTRDDAEARYRFALAWRAAVSVGRVSRSWLRCRPTFARFLAVLRVGVWVGLRHEAGIGWYHKCLWLSRLSGTWGGTLRGLLWADLRREGPPARGSDLSAPDRGSILGPPDRLAASPAKLLPSLVQRRQMRFAYTDGSIDVRQPCDT